MAVHYYDRGTQILVLQTVAVSILVYFLVIHGGPWFMHIVRSYSHPVNVLKVIEKRNAECTEIDKMAAEDIRSHAMPPIAKEYRIASRPKKISLIRQHVDNSDAHNEDTDSSPIIKETTGMVEPKSSTAKKFSLSSKGADSAAAQLQDTPRNSAKNASIPVSHSKSAEPVRRATTHTSAAVAATPAPRDRLRTVGVTAVGGDFGPTDRELVIADQDEAFNRSLAEDRAKAKRSDASLAVKVGVYNLSIDFSFLIS